MFTVTRSKTDQTGQGRVVGVLRTTDSTGRLCPVRALLAWRRRPRRRSGRAGVNYCPAGRRPSGTVWAGLPAGYPARARRRPRSRRRRPAVGAAVAEILKRRARAAGLDPVVLAAHSLRSGHATQAAKNGAGELAIAEQLGHQHLQTTRRYVRRARAAADGTSGYLGL